MCWISENKQKVMIAKKDIKVFKVCWLSDYDEIESMYFRELYELGKKYRLVFSDLREYEELSVANRGFHSYSEDCEIKESGLQAGFFHIYAKDGKEVDWFIIDDKLAVKCSCIIPKGARYIINEHGEYVSDEIIIKSIEKKLGIIYLLTPNILFQSIYQTITRNICGFENGGFKSMSHMLLALVFSIMVSTDI